MGLLRSFRHICPRFRAFRQSWGQRALAMGMRRRCSMVGMDGATFIYSESSDFWNLYFDVCDGYQNFLPISLCFWSIYCCFFIFFLYALTKSGNSVVLSESYEKFIEFQTLLPEKFYYKIF